jgi:hypothetical protein
MARYILNPGFELCGWKGLPFALRHPNLRDVDFFKKDRYEIVLAMDGRHEVDRDALPEEHKQLLDRLLKIGAAVVINK